jgi:TPR repeat protein
MAKHILVKKIYRLLLSLGTIFLITVLLDKFLGSDPNSSEQATLSQAPDFLSSKTLSSTYIQMDLSEIIDLANEGDMYAQFLIARKYYVGEDMPMDYEMAHKFFLLAGEQGEVNSQFTAAYMYQVGEGVDVDMQKAYEWYLRAADQDDAYSQYMLGQLFSLNDGYRLDYEEAFKWFKIASDNGFALAHYELGLMYFYGIGIEKDLAVAKSLFILSVEEGEVEAYDILCSQFQLSVGQNSCV